jgi:ribonuclease P protein component
LISSVSAISAFSSEAGGKKSLSVRSDGKKATVSEKTNAFPRTHRLSGKLAFAAVYDAAVKRTRGPLVMFTRPNAVSHSRWGLSVSRRVGTAARRNRIKRLLRESIRLMKPELPMGYDVIIVVRPHVPAKLTEYQSLVADLIQQSHARWQRSPKE